MPTKQRRTSKITILQPLELKRTIEQAAAKRGMSVTSFVNGVLARAAERTLERVRRREISERDQQALMNFLAHPKGPNNNLLKAARRYRERYGA